MQPDSGSGTDRPSRAVRELLEWLPNNIATLLALLGLGGVLAYGALNVASTIFYQGLGVTPSAVGLGYATSRSSMTLRRPNAEASRYQPPT